MSIELVPPLVYTELSGYAGIQALVGNGDSPATFRVSNGVASQDTARPYLTYQVLFDTPYNSLTSADGEGTNRVRVQVTSYSDVESESYSLAKQVKNAMRLSTTFRSLYLNTVPGYEPDTKLFSVITDYSVVTK